MSKQFSSTIAGAAILITGVGLVSKGFGFLREIVYANNFGLQTNFDSYLVGAVLPITLNTSIIYLAQNFFIPTYHKKLHEGKERSINFLASSFWLFLLLSTCVSIILYISSPLIISSYLTHKNPQVYEAVLQIFRIFIFTIPLNAGFAILSSYFQAEYNFKSPALSTLFQNIIIILLVVLFTKTIGVLAIPIGYLIGTALQLFYLIYLLKGRKELLAFRLFSEIGELKIADKTFLTIVFVEIINQLYILVDRYFFGSVDTGGIAALNYAFILFALPISIFSLALSTAIFPKLSQAFGSKDNESAEFNYLSGLRINIFLFIPIAMILFLFGDSIIQLFYQRGSYTANDTQLTYAILKLYSISLVFFSSYAIINKVVYGAGLVKQLLIISILVFIAKIVLNFLLVQNYKQNGLALSTTICFIVLSVSCYLVILSKLKFKITKQLLVTISFYLINGIIAYLVSEIFDELFYLPQLLSFFIQIIIFIGVFAVNVILIEPKEYLMIKDTLFRYLL